MKKIIYMALAFGFLGTMANASIGVDEIEGALLNGSKVIFDSNGNQFNILYDDKPNVMTTPRSLYEDFGKLNKLKKGDFEVFGNNNSGVSGPDVIRILKMKLKKAPIVHSSNPPYTYVNFFIRKVGKKSKYDKMGYRIIIYKNGEFPKKYYKQYGN